MAGTLESLTRLTRPGKSSLGSHHCGNETLNIRTHKGAHTHAHTYIQGKALADAKALACVVVPGEL